MSPLRRVATAACLAGTLVLAISSVAGTVAATAKTKTVHVAVVGPFANTFFGAEVAGLRKVASQAKGEKVVITAFNSNFDTTLEYSQVAGLATSGQYQGVALAALDGTGLVPAVKEDIAAGVKVVALNNELGPNQTTAQNPQVLGQTAYVGDPPSFRAPLMGELIVDACKGKSDCQVGYIAGVLSIPIEQAAISGIKGYIKSHSNIHLVSILNGGQYLAGPSETVTETMLTADPNISVIAASGDQEIAGAAIAVDARGLTHKVKLIGYGASSTAMKALDACTAPWYGTVAMVPNNEGQLAMKYLIEALSGKTIHVGISATKYLEKTKHFNPLITCGNAKSFKSQWQG